MILFKECLKNSLVPFIVSDDRKTDYYHALNAAQTKEDYGALEAFFLEEQAEYRALVEGFVLPVHADRSKGMRKKDGRAKDQDTR